MIEKDKILSKLASLSLEQLDKHISTANLEEMNVVKALHLLIDKEIDLRETKWNELISAGNSHSKAETLMRHDPELISLKKQIKQLRFEKYKVTKQLEMYKAYYWKARQ